MIAVGSKSTITLHFTRNITDVKISNGETSIVVEEVEHDHSTDQVTFHLQETLQPAELYKLWVKYRFLIPTATEEEEDKGKGIFQDSFRDVNNSIRHIAATQMVPLGARKAFPCFDEPSLKATVSFAIGHSDNLIALANTPENFTEPV